MHTPCENFKASKFVFALCKSSRANVPVVFNHLTYKPPNILRNNFKRTQVLLYLAAVGTVVDFSNKMNKPTTVSKSDNPASTQT